MDMIEAMRIRHSVRNFNGQPLSSVEKEELLSAINTATNPFGGECRIALLEKCGDKNFKPSTYGIIRGATDYLAMYYGDSQADALGAGFSMEQVVLRAVTLGLGTCWISGTFRPATFTDESVFGDRSPKVVCPVGTAAGRSWLDRAMRFSVGSDRRLPFSQLFFNGDDLSPLSEKSEFVQALQMMRLAPSSTNSQPWRAIVSDGQVHFFSKDRKPLHILDCGIGLFHFTLTEQHQGRTGSFTLCTHPAPDSTWLPLVTYTRQ